MRTWSAIALKGKDTSDFLQRVTTVAVKSLAVKSGSTGLLLTGTGKVIADFFLLRLMPDEFFLISDVPTIQRLSSELEKLHFSEDFTQKVHACAVAIQPNADFRRPFPIEIMEDRFRWPLPEGFWAELSFDEPSPVEISPAEWERARILARVPRFGHECQPGETNALDCGFLPWIDRAKGCYPGQEVVERSLNVGHPARVLLLLESEIELEVGEELLSETEKTCGKITSAISRPEGGSFALAIVQWSERDRTEITVAGKGAVRCRR